MNEDDNKFNGFGHTFTWGAKEEDMHPYTYKWTDVPPEAETVLDGAYLDLIDRLVDDMTSYPDADEIIDKIRSNIA